jgi:hypothetical protein
MKFLGYLFATIFAVSLPVAVEAQYFNMPGSYTYALNSVRHVMDLSPDGKLGVTLTDRVIVFDPLTGAQLDTKPSGFGPLGIYLAQTSLGLRVAVLTSNGGPRRIAVFSLSAAGKLTQLADNQLTTSNCDCGSGVVLSGPGQVGFVNVISSSDSSMNDFVAFSLVDGSIIRKTPMLAGGEMGFSEVGGKRTIAMLKGSTVGVQWFDVTDPTAPPSPLGDVTLTLNHSGNGGSPAHSIVFSGDGRYIFFVNPGVFFSVIDTVNKQVVSSINDNQSFINQQLFEDSQRRLIILEATPFFGQNGSSVIRLVDATDPAHLVNLNQTNFPANFTQKGDLAFSKDASRLYLLNRAGLMAVSLPSFSAIWQQTGPVNLEQQLIVYGPTDELLGAWDNLNGTGNTSVIGALPPDPPTISISDTSVTEGDTANVNADFTVTLSAPSTHRIGISYATAGVTAQSGVDFTNLTGTLTFAAGETSKIISVPIIGDLTDEFDETFTLNLSNPTAALLSTSKATATILDNDPPPTVSVSDLVRREFNSGTTNLTITATIDRVSAKPVTFDYATVDGSATAGSDYTATSGSLSFTGGGTTRTFVVSIFGDPNVEPDETFSIKLSNPQNVTFARSSATVTIVSDDSSTGNPLDLNGFFVRQQYLDFLGRDPDTDGFNFWTNNTNNCGADAACAEVQRVNTSGAFFLSIEFQQTGYLVERFYKSAYGDAMGSSTLNSSHQLAVPIVRASELFSDSALISAGVVVLQPGWEQKLENNKQTFAESFVLRSRFVNEYPDSMTPAAFVDKLNSRAGNPLSTTERDQLATDLTAKVKTRGQVLRTIAEHTNLVNAEFNRAFVLMQYFGYLRRNPNDAPDSDYTGYDFWLTKLNQFNGDYIGAEMVKAFIGSSEYRKRFGP